MTLKTRISSLLIANRGEIAIRIARAASELGMASVAVYAEDDAQSLHCRLADRAAPLPQRGVAAYLDMDAIIAAAREARCEAIHPGYGFLAENPTFARGCAEAGILFVGPSADALALFGDKTAARKLAADMGVPTLPGTMAATSLEDAAAFLERLGPGGAIMIKALSGGGGRGMRIVTDAARLPELYDRCASEAARAFGSGGLYVEQFVPHCRHIEVQIVGDGTGEAVHLGERECTLQRRHQKIVEIAPSPGLSAAARQALCDDAIRLAKSCRYSGLGTVEFLADASDDSSYWFIEANPRIQVEHTITEQVTGIDLVQAQIRIAQGSTLAELGLLQAQIPAPRGAALQLRVNMETMDRSGDIHPTAGTIDAYDMPSGPGVRVDGYGYVGYATNPGFDPLLAKLVFTVASAEGTAGYERLIAKASRGLQECRVSGVETNLPFLKALLAHSAVRENRVHARFIEDEQPALVTSAETFGTADNDRPASIYSTASIAAATVAAPPGTFPVVAPMLGVVASLAVQPGDLVLQGRTVAILEAMKMEYPITMECSGVVRAIVVEQGASLAKGATLLFVEPVDLDGDARASDEAVPPDTVPPSLAEALERRQNLQDARRPEAVARRRKTGQRTVRENIDALCDPSSFIEYGGLALAAQRGRRTVGDLIEMSPADGLVAGIGSVNGRVFGPAESRCMVLGYDYTVFAGTQGVIGHKKTDRMFGIAAEHPMPVVLFAEGGGGRPGDTDALGVAGLEITTFARLARLSGKAPLIGVVSGRCFAGNAALLGCCDVIIATENSTIGMGGPAMIEGGGLGVFKPEDVGPVSVQLPNGVIDIAVADESAAVDTARQYLAYFQGRVATWTCSDQKLLRHIIPGNRLRIYDVRRVIEGLADIGSVLELRSSFGVGMITALVRIEGRPIGLIANDPRHLSGAIDSVASDKGARFLQLCDAFGLPVVSLCDTPGFMVGPESEKTAAVRHVSRLFMIGANLSIPLIAVILRKGYGLGAMAMTGGGFHEPILTVAWPTGEVGGMGLEGAVRLGYRRELEAVKDPAERETLFRWMVAEAYDKGKATNAASFFEFDDVIDPAETRQLIAKTFNANPATPRRTDRHRFIDSW